MTETPAFNSDFWVAIAAAAPALLIAFAATYEQLLARVRETAPYRRAFDRAWAGSWTIAVPFLGGAVTLFSFVVLIVGRDTPTVEIVAGVAVAALLVGVVSSVTTLRSLRRRFPPDGVWEVESPSKTERRNQRRLQDQREEARIQRVQQERREQLSPAPGES